MKNKNLRFKMIGLILSIVISLGMLAGCGSASAKTVFTIGGGTYAEKDILGYMIGILIEEYTDLTVKRAEPMAYSPGMAALKSGELDLRVTYDGSMLTYDLAVDPTEVPAGADLYEWVNDRMIENGDYKMITKFLFQNTYALAVTKEFAQEHDLVTTSDLIPLAQDFVFGAEHEFFGEEYSVNAYTFSEAYGLEWKDMKSLDLDLKYSALISGNLDVTMVYTTDGLNKKFDLTVLEDDLHYFPQYYGTYVVRVSIFEDFKDTAPNLEEVFMMLDGMIDDATMTDMNYIVDTEADTAKNVARQFLIDNNLISE
ncbi:MAG: glycine betaine ABC transporter substrate-binding protein [Eubacteriales bacterium]|nr:glycine betaine ABC transporter substrate-binding protein [Eubacteriales bacterium]